MNVWHVVEMLQFLTFRFNISRMGKILTAGFAVEEAIEWLCASDIKSKSAGRQ